MAWTVTNINGDDQEVVKRFETYQEAAAYAEFTLGEIKYVTKLEEMIIRAEQIVADQHLSKQEKDVRLGIIMTEMERDYEIPMQYDPKFESENLIILSEYRHISNMRSM